MINYERNAELRKMFAEAAKTHAMNYTRSDTPPPVNTTKQKPEGVTIEGMCIECGNGKHRFILAQSVADKYAGTIRETMTQSPCQCGGYLWLISIPPANSRIDDLIE